MSNIPMDLETSFQDEKNRIYGCLFGGWCGDASGATLEFCNNNITEEMVFKSMNMCGGGILNVGRGQITGDSELEIASIHAIVRKTEECKNTFGGLCSTEHKSFEIPLEHIANEYINWYLSKPFDVGNTCSNAFRNSRSLKDMLSRAQTLNQTSTENGSLTRIAAIAIWSRKLSDNEIMNIGRKEATLSHVHKICQEINGLYCLIIAKLIIGHSPFTVLELVEKYISQSTLSESHYTTSTIKEWFDKSVSLSNIDCRISSGSIKHAFMLVLYFLRESIKRDVSYEEAIKTVLLKGGDTDTNAKIVGNVIGIMVNGIKGIPEYMIKPVLDFDCTKSGKIRPEKYSVKKVMNLIPYLF